MGDDEKARMGAEVDAALKAYNLLEPGNPKNQTGAKMAAITAAFKRHGELYRAYHEKYTPPEPKKSKFNDPTMLLRREKPKHPPVRDLPEAPAAAAAGAGTAGRRSIYTLRSKRRNVRNKTQRRAGKGLVRQGSRSHRKTRRRA